MISKSESIFKGILYVLKSNTSFALKYLILFLNTTSTYFIAVIYKL